MGFDSPVHWLIVILVVALLFGGSRVGNLMGELGKGIRAFKQNVSDTAAPEANQTGKPAAPPQAEARIAEANPPAPQPAVSQPSVSKTSEAEKTPEAAHSDRL